MNKRIFAWSGVMMLLAAIFVWGMTGHPKAAGENSDRKAQAVSGAGVSGGAVSGAAVSPSCSNRKQFDTGTYACSQP